MRLLKVPSGRFRIRYQPQSDKHRWQSRLLPDGDFIPFPRKESDAARLWKKAVGIKLLSNMKEKGNGDRRLLK